jgi:transposase
MKTPICGLDVSSSSAYTTLRCPQNTVLHKGLFHASPEDLKKLLDILPPKTRVFLESTGRYHQFWARELTAAGHCVYLLNPLLAKRLQPAAKALRHNKSDPGDADNLADTGRIHGDELAHCIWREDPSNDATRVLARVRSRQRNQLTDTLKAAQDLLGRILPEVPELNLASLLKLSPFLLEIKSLKQLCGLHLATLEKHLGKHGEKLHALLRGPLNAAAIFDHLLPALHEELRQVESLREGQIRLDEQIETSTTASGRADQVRLARTIPGIGPKTGPVLVSALPRELHTLGTKRDAQRKALALLGCEPRLRDSGKMKGRRTMTKRGDRVARTALFQAASCAIMHDERMKAHYDSQKKLGKAHRVAVSHVMRRTLWRLVAVLYDGKDFLKIAVETPSPPNN